MAKKKSGRVREESPTYDTAPAGRPSALQDTRIIYCGDNLEQFVSFDYSDDALAEIDQFFRKTGKVIVPLTVREILDEQLARKLA